MLAEIGMEPRDLVDALQELGDPSQRQTIAARVRRWVTGETATPGEVIALVTLLGRVVAATIELGAIVRVGRK